MELAAYEPGVVLEFDDFYQAVVRRCAGEDEAGIDHFRAVFVVEFPAMAMAFVNEVGAIDFMGLRAFGQLAGIEAEAHGAAFIGDVDLVGHEVDDREFGIFMEFRRRSAFEADDVAGEFHDSALHTQAEAEVRHVVFTGILDGTDLAFDAAVAEAAGNDDTVDAFEDFFHREVRVFQSFRIDPVDIDFRLIGDASMVQSFSDAEVGVVESDVFTDQGDFQGLFRIVNGMDHFLPVFHIAGTIGQVEFFQDDAVHPFFRQEEGYFIDAVQGLVFDDGIFVDVAEQGQLFFHFVRQGAFRPADDDIRLDADTAQFLDAVLGRFGLQFAGSADIRYEGDVDVQDVIAADFLLDLADSFQERQAFDVADSTADFGDDDVRIVIVADAVDAVLDFIGDVRDDLDSMAQIVAAPFFLQDRPVDLAGRDVGVLAEVNVDEAFIVTEVEVRFRAIVGDEDFAVLVRAHRARVDIDIGVKLLDRDLVAAVLQQTAQRCCCNAFP